MSTITLKPGYLVGLATAIKGGVQYSRKDLNAADAAADAAIVVEEGAAASAWETVKVVDDPQEHERAVKVRGKARSLITGVCIASPFGLLCPKEKEELLKQQLEEAKQRVADFNATAQKTRVDIWCIMGQIVESDTEAAKGIAAEIHGLIAEMEEGIAGRDAEKIREAARKAKALGGMLDENLAGKVSKAIEIARAGAREIVKHLEDRGSASLILVADTQMQALRDARAAFLDMDEPVPVEPLPVTSARALDVDEPSFEEQEIVSNESRLRSVPLDTGEDVDASRAVDSDVAGYAAVTDMDVE